MSMLITEVWRQFERKDKLAQRLWRPWKHALPQPHCILLTTAKNTFHRQASRLFCPPRPWHTRQDGELAGDEKGLLGDPCLTPEPGCCWKERWRNCANPQAPSGPPSSTA